jgi:Ssp1 endopeptidase immunity protein Rap1a
MNLRTLALAALVAAGIGEPATATDMSGIALRNWCSSGKPGSIDAMNCRTFMLGFINGLALADGFGGNKSWCMPTDLTDVQAALIVSKYMREHPEALHMPPGLIAGRALYVPYACARSGE